MAYLKLFLWGMKVLPAWGRRRAKIRRAKIMCLEGSEVRKGPWLGGTGAAVASAQQVPEPE